MSADAWRPCPRCLKKHNADLDSDRKKAAAAYGKVPAEQWRAMTLAVEEKAKADLEEDSFREDYCIGTLEDGKFEISYMGRCMTEGCGYVVKYKYSDA